MTNINADVKNSLVPTGRLRAAINRGNAVLVQSNPKTGAPTGVTVDLAHALAKRLSLPLELVLFDAAGAVFEALKRDAWDIAFLAIDPVRATEIEFTSPYVIIEGNYAVPTASRLNSLADIDKPENRIAVVGGSAYDLHLTRTIKSAKLLRSANADSSIAKFLDEKLEAIAGVKKALLNYIAGHPGLRMIEPPFMQIKQAMGTPHGRAAGAAYVKAFIEEMKASGFVAASLKRGGQEDATIAPLV
jgi:polar amino acid transport system substrate-binding protein